MDLLVLRLPLDCWALLEQNLQQFALLFLVPIHNIAAVIVMIIYNRQEKNTKMSRVLLKEITRNPLIIAVVLGLLFNYFQIALPKFATSTLELAGDDGALRLFLLCVGAGLAPSFAASRIGLFFAAVVKKLIIFPAMEITARV